MVVVFGISWLPHHIVHLWAEFGDFPLTQASFLFRVTAHCLAYSNSSVNPIIYAFLSENFRKAYKQVFKCQVGNRSSLNDIKESKSKIDTPQSTNSTHVWKITVNVLVSNAGFSYEWTCKIKSTKTPKLSKYFKVDVDNCDSVYWSSGCTNGWWGGLFQWWDTLSTEKHYNIILLAECSNEGLWKLC